MIDEQAHLSLLVRQSRSNLEAQTALKYAISLRYSTEMMLWCSATAAMAANSGLSPLRQASLITPSSGQS